MHHIAHKNPASSIIFTAEHATYDIPEKYKNLGLTAHETQHSKDLFDPGSLELARSLAEHFNASLIYPLFSRLVIDANRRIDAASNKHNTFHAAALKTQLLVEDETGERLIKIPHNQKNQEAEERTRWEKYVRPYYEGIVELSENLLAAHPKITIIQIHSFFPTYNGNIRTVDIDVIHSGTALGEKNLEFLRSHSRLSIGDNEPWSMQAVDGGILKPLQGDPWIDLLAYDINNKHLRTPAGVDEIASLLTDSLKNSLS